MVLSRASSHLGGLRVLAEEAGAALEGKPEVRLFVTPPRAETFRCHHDAEDVVEPWSIAIAVGR